MDTENIITCEKIEDVTETFEKIGYWHKAVIGFGITALACVITYKFVIKPITAKIKVKKQQTFDENYGSPIYYDDEPESDEN